MSNQNKIRGLIAHMLSLKCKLSSVSALLKPCQINPISGEQWTNNGFNISAQNVYFANDKK